MHYMMFANLMHIYSKSIACSVLVSILTPIAQPPVFAITSKMTSV